jgi:hypothetical protein
MTPHLVCIVCGKPLITCLVNEFAAGRWLAQQQGQMVEAGEDIDSESTP